MYLYSYFINIKKEKKDYILIYKTEVDKVLHNDINIKLYKELNPEIEYNNTINFYELFYIKPGIKLEYNKIIWNDLIKIYISNLSLNNLINKKFINKIYSQNILLFDLEMYNQQIKEFFINYYNKNQ